MPKIRAILIGALALLVAAPLFLAAQGRFRGFSPSTFANVPYNGQFTFTRIRYPSGSWSHDYPQADRHMPQVLDFLTTVRSNLDGSNVFRLDDPALFQHPIAYVSEPGFWDMTESEVQSLRDYCLKGGFVIFDDFEAEQWHNFEAQIKRSLPEYRLIEIGPEHPIFNAFFKIDDIYAPHPTVDVIPKYYGMFVDDDPARNMMVIVSYNNDLAEYWEWGHTKMFSEEKTSEAYKIGVNYLIYAMTH